jgi:hypothetical protein
LFQAKFKLHENIQNSSIQKNIEGIGNNNNLAATIFSTHLSAKQHKCCKPSSSKFGHPY